MSKYDITKLIKMWANDGCIVEPDGTCEHGCESVLLAEGLI